MSDDVPEVFRAALAALAELRSRLQAAGEWESVQAVSAAELELHNARRGLSRPL